MGRSLKFRLLALDIDGTLLDSASRLSARTRDAVRAAHAAGVKIVLVTGRRAPAARRVAAQLLPDLPLVLHNGALLLAGDGTVLDCAPLGQELAQMVVAQGRHHTRDMVVHAGLVGQGRLLAEPTCRGNAVLSRYLERSHSDVEWCEDLTAVLDSEVLAIMFGDALAPIVALVEELGKHLGSGVRVEKTLYPSLGIALVDVIHAGVTKAAALRSLQARWGISATETIAIGDNWNDREMLLEAGLGLVMGNADLALHAMGLPVLPPNDSDGVAFGIERYILGRYADRHE